MAALLPAKEGEHWAFIPPQRHAPPEVKKADWPQNSIDRFILVEIEKANLTPSREADRVILLRRVYLDLIGLPPMPAEVSAFIKDKRPDAYERVVDRLLASKHFGERWGRHWLDLARYADSDGYSHDAPRSIWPYRDWVIKAFNDDLPFDQFIIEQLAGDMLPNATLQQRIATGFHRNTQINTEGGVDKEQFRVDSIFDRIATTGEVMFGLTFGCVQCHDHKFDPLKQTEFYQMFAFFNQADEPRIEAPTGLELKARAEHSSKIAALDAKVKAAKENSDERKTEKGAAEGGDDAGNGSAKIASRHASFCERRFHAEGRESTIRGADGAARIPGRSQGEPTGLRALGGQQAQPATRACYRESHVAALLWRGAGGDGE